MASHVNVGVMEGTSVVNICTQDLREFWLEAKKGGKVLLWCDALKDGNPKTSRCHI